MENNKKGDWVLPVIIILIITIGAMLVFGQKKDKTPTSNIQETETTASDTNVTDDSNLTKAEYSDGENTVTATFNNDPNNPKNSSVTFEGASMGPTTLPIAMSASGARYASEEEDIVFWEHQGVVTISQNGKDVFVGKLVKSDNQ